jgi:hypothetical protein
MMVGTLFGLQILTRNFHTYLDGPVYAWHFKTRREIREKQACEQQNDDFCAPRRARDLASSACTAFTSPPNRHYVLCFCRSTRLANGGPRNPLLAKWRAGLDFDALAFASLSYITPL